MKNKRKVITVATLLLLIIGGLALLFIGFPLNAQKQGDKITKKPDVKINVRKETDKNGNITRYDSTYVSTWSSGDMNGLNADSIINSFRQQFHSYSFGSHPFAGDSTNFFNDDFFNNDNLFYGDNFSSGFFRNFHSNAFKEMEEMMKQHKSLMEQFYNRPGLNIPQDSMQQMQPVPQQSYPKQNSYSGGLQL